MYIKICSKCKIEKNISEFYKDSSKNDGLRPSCKECCLNYAKNYYKKDIVKINTSEYRKNKYMLLNKSDKLKINIQKKIYNKNNPEKLLLYGSKSRAKKLAINHNIEEDDIMIPEYCPVLGLKLELSDFLVSDNSPTIDRIDNSKGYIKENIMIISWRANKIKNNSNLEELEKIKEYMIGENK